MKGAGRYELLCKIASGGAASVYVGRLVEGGADGELVAIKRPHSHLLETPGFAKSLLDEARIASRIHHPNVVAVRDVVSEGASVRLVMDYVEGASLAALVRGEPVPVGIALRIIKDACAGLDAAHRAVGEDGQALHVVHRDVSPHNLLVGTDGVCRITDFGIAKCLAENTAETTQGAVKGKVAYMAPEQVLGRSLDRRTDLFALGIVAWEMLTGARLFRGQTDAESIARVLSSAPRPPSELEPGIPPALDAVILAALAKSPDSRPNTAADLSASLEQASLGRVAELDDVSRWVFRRSGEEIDRRRTEIALARTRETTSEIVSVSESSLSGSVVAPESRRRQFIALTAIGGVAALLGAVALGARHSALVPPSSPATGGTTVPSTASASLLTDPSPHAGARLVPAESAAPPVALTATTSEPPHGARRLRSGTTGTARPSTETRGPGSFKAAPNPYR